ncbi:MAG: polysaccharide biosynthesis tyrosine autokinase [Bacilli bacterium]|nr:polysaccharide biosynthesis tyrosine autokinase [Bacilli bacterium]
MEEFNILEFLNYYWNKIIFVVILTFLGLIASLIFTYRIQVPVFQSKTSLVLVNNSEDNSSITQNDININKNLVSTYREIIQSKLILNKVISNMRLDISYEDLKSHVKVNSVQDTEIINIYVYNEDKRLSKNIAKQIASVFETEIVEIYNIENVSIIDEATVDEEPYNVHVLKQIVIGTGIGFLLSSLIIAICFYFDDTVKSEEEIEKGLKVPILGSVPKYHDKIGSTSGKDLIICSDSKSGISEAIRTLRTNLQFSSIDKKLKTILVTSSVPGEGKSFVASNLAVALANSGSRVLLVDCDIRRGRQHHIFGFPNKKGLSNLLLEDVGQVYRSYINESKIPNLYLMFKGVTPPNPSELLNSEKNKRLIASLSNNFDILVFDGAPINGLADSLVMSTLVDGVIVVTAYKETSKTLLEDTKKNLDNVNANIMGIVLNRTNTNKSKYYGHYYE